MCRTGLGFKGMNSLCSNPLSDAKFLYELQEVPPSPEHHVPPLHMKCVEHSSVLRFVWRVEQREVRVLFS